MRTRAEEEALRRRAPGLRGLGEATAAHPGIEKVCVMLHVRYSSSFFFACCSAVMVFDKMCRSSIAHLDCSANDDAPFVVRWIFDHIANFSI